MSASAHPVEGPGRVDPYVTFGLEDGVATVSLCRPERRNGIDLPMATELVDALSRCRDTTGVRAVLIRADGEHFSVGGDLVSLSRDPEHLHARIMELVPLAQEATALVAELDIPVVCAARGAAAGAALGLLWGADLAVVGDDLQLVTGFAAAGLSGDGGSSWYLPRLAGLRRAAELLMLNRRLGAEEAVEWGLVSRAVPSAELDSEATAAARVFADGPTVALGRMRALLRAGSPTLREHLEAEAKGIAACAATDDLAGAIAAFAAKRVPVFAGR